MNVLIAVGIVYSAAALILAGIWWLDRRHDKAWKAERPEWNRPPLPQRVRVDTAFAAHPSAVRIADLIAANEAARIDAEWEAMNS